MLHFKVSLIKILFCLTGLNDVISFHVQKFLLRTAKTNAQMLSMCNNVALDWIYPNFYFLTKSFSSKL